MNKQIPLGISISLIAIACAVTFVLTMTVSLNIYNQKAAGVQEREGIYAQLQEMDSFVRGNYTGTIDDDVLIEQILRGYINGLDDPYAAYLSSADYMHKSQLESGSLVTTGLIVKEEANGYLSVTGVYEGSSAAEAGIRTGSIITKIEGDTLLTIGTKNALRALSGEEGTRLSVAIQNDGEEDTHTLIFKKININTIKYAMADGILYLRILDFNDLTGEQISSAISSFPVGTVKGLILDVRGNASNYYAALNEVFNLFIPHNLIASVQYSTGTLKTLNETTSGQNINIPMVVLMDETTSAAAELLAVSLRDFSSAKLVGSVTKGNATVQSTQVFLNGSAVTVTTGIVIPAHSDTYQGTGIKPEFAVERTTPIEQDLANLTQTADAQLKKALEVIASMAAQ